MERCEEVEELTRALYEAVSRADLAWFVERLARTTPLAVVGTAPDEWWDDRATLLHALRAQMEAAGADSVLLTPGALRADREGDVAWVADRPVLRVGAVSVECRHTAVFVREELEWRLVQHHFSVGVPNEEVFGDEASRLG